MNDYLNQINNKIIVIFLDDDAKNLERWDEAYNRQLQALSIDAQKQATIANFKPSTNCADLKD
jgi:hypothetical protein